MNEPKGEPEELIEKYKNQSRPKVSWTWWIGGVVVIIPVLVFWWYWL